ncbi:MAG TPA: hypothetical protein ENF22_01580, partial [Chloroflexi bacterium]|nr:hypothetical protein [Chloroflexota bacterium]
MAKILASLLVGQIPACRIAEESILCANLKYKKCPLPRALGRLIRILTYGVGVQVGWQGQLGSSYGHAGVQVGMGVLVLVTIIVGVGVGVIGVGLGIFVLVGFGVLVDSGVKPIVGVLLGSGVLLGRGVGDFLG